MNNNSNPKECSIVFTGDIGFDKYMSGRWNDSNLLDDEILAFFAGADHTVANIEGALISATDDGSRGAFFHSMDPAAVRVIEEIGSDIWCIGNNHTMDAGEAGLNSTRALARERGCRTIGAGGNELEASAPVYFDEAGGIGIFGVAYLNECVPATATQPGILPWNNMGLISRRIAEIKATCRRCIIVAHGGEEFADLPNPYTRDRYIEYLNLGADVVVAHHPHVPENYELFPDGKAIFYSLGNFIFDTDYQRVHPYTDTGVLLKLIFTPEDMRFEALGTRVLRGEERIAAAPLPAVFTDIPAREYERLSPLSAAAFIREERKKMIYLEPSRFTGAPDDVWDRYFYSTEPDGYYKGEHMDLSLIVPLAARSRDGDWQSSPLEGVKEYLLRHFE